MITIIGGGIIGLSIAWRLSQAGRAVTVLNAGNRGGEASPAGAGMLAPGGEFDGPSVWTTLGVESHRLYGAFVSELSAETGLAIDYRVCGGIEVARSEDERRALLGRAQRQAAAGIESIEIDEGLLYPNAAYVDPREVLRALRAACSARSVDILDGHGAGEIAADPFDALVIAAGAWSGRLTVMLRGRTLPLPRTIPVKGHLIGYRLPPDSLRRIRRRGHTYVLQRATGLTIAGSTEERVGFDAKVDPEICRDLHRRAVELWPTLEEYSPSECWIGFRPATEDMLPRIGRFEDTNVWLAYGHYRNGILLAPVTAALVSRQIISSSETGSHGLEPAPG